MLLPGGELATVRGHAQWQDTPHGRCTQGCQQLRGEAPQGARPSGEPSGSAADPDARSAREGEPSVQRPASYGPRGLQAASTADRLTPSMACRGCSSQCPGNNSVLSMRGADVVLEISMWRRKRRNSLRMASPGSGILVAALPSIG
ncbi:hypothetical protein TcBrA4_0021760 [Trypanosoma cruzi]|nr:hypothetical protein TcBrA4_0021760 [Trypanosoma cruzi]